MIFTGVDGEKTFSVEFGLFRKEWKPASKKGRKIYAVPSHLCFVKREETQMKPHELKRYLQLELEGEEYLWDFAPAGNFYYLTLVRDFEPPPDAYALDCELFSLARLSRPLGEPNLTVLDLGRRKTTLVRTEDYLLKTYRVLLRGGDYLTELVAKEEKLPFEEAERLKKEKGLQLPYLREAVVEMLRELGIEEEKVLLSGGGARLKGFKELFKEVALNPYAEPELNTAMGASLKFFYRDPSPSFRREELSPRELKALTFLLGASTIVFLALLLGEDFLKKRIALAFQERKKELFKEKFPHLPPVMVDAQVRQMARAEGRLVKKLEELLSSLPEGVKILRISYKDGRLKVVGEGTEEAVKKIKAVSVRKTPQGTYEFEVVK